MDTRPAGGLLHAGALAVVSELARRVAAEPEALEEALSETARSLKEELDLWALVIEVRVGGGEIRAHAGELDVLEDGSRTLELPILRDRLNVGMMYVSARRDPVPYDVRDALASISDVLSLAVSSAESSATASRRASQASVVQLASEALSRTLDEGQVYRTVLTLAIELLDSRAGAVLEAEGAPVASVGFGRFPGALEKLSCVGHPGRAGWQDRADGGYVVGVPFGKEGGSVFLFRDERAYENADLASLKLVARQLSHAKERSRLRAALEHRDLEAIQALSSALESRDGTTGEHIGRTQRLVESVALELGFEPEEARAARYAAILHDIGKIGVPDHILNKPGPLSEEEWEIMRRHPQIGANILSSIAGFQRISEAVLSHHERFDGGGYPRGLTGERIPVEARIVSAVDAYDAMTSDRPYRRALSHETALEELGRNAGTQFDPRVIQSIERVVGELRTVKDD